MTTTPTTGISLREWCDHHHEEFTVGYARGVSQSTFVTVNSQGLTTHQEQLNLDRLFEVRLFSPTQECRWQWDQTTQTSTTTALTDESCSAHGWVPHTPLAQRIIRGACTETNNGWSKFHDGFTSPVWVPKVFKKGKRIAVSAQEYKTTDNHGNVAIVAERLTTFVEVS